MSYEVEPGGTVDVEAVLNHNETTKSLSDYFLIDTSKPDFKLTVPKAVTDAGVTASPLATAGFERPVTLERVGPLRKMTWNAKTTLTVPANYLDFEHPNPIEGQIVASKKPEPGAGMTVKSRATVKAIHPFEILVKALEPITLAPLFHSLIQRIESGYETKQGSTQFTDEEMIALYESVKTLFWASTTWQDSPNFELDLWFEGNRNRGYSPFPNTSWMSAKVDAYRVFVYDTSAYVGRKITRISEWTPKSTFGFSIPVVPYGIILWPSATERPDTTWTEMLANFIPYPELELPNEITLSNYLLVAGHIDLTQTTGNQKLGIQSSSRPETIE